MEAIEPPAGYQSSQSAAATRGSDVPLFTDAPAGGKRTIWWQPDGLLADAGLIFTLALLHVWERMDVISAHRHTPVACLFWHARLSRCIFRIHPPSPRFSARPGGYPRAVFFFAPAQVYSGLARCFFSTESRIERDPKRGKESVCSQRLEN